ncbi:MAG TPA: hypothetical protein VN133_05330 [Humibacter sp.]|nr:hypothetical protein [Humibacter sp.]
MAKPVPLRELAPAQVGVFRSTDLRPADIPHSAGFRMPSAARAPILSNVTDSHHLVLTRDATAGGRQRDLYRAHASGTMVRVRHGVFAAVPALAESGAEERYRMAVEAAMLVRRDAVATSVSATVLLGLPLFGPPPELVYLLSPGRSGRRRNGVVELSRRGAEAVVETDGFLMTDLPYSILQACRHTPFRAALTIVESAIHVPRSAQSLPLCTPEQLWATYDRLLPFPRSARVRAVLTYATTLCETPLESISRVVIDELGFPQPLQQYELWLPRIGRRAFLDFAWPDHMIAGEADGWGKYFDRERSLGPIERIKREKRRDDAIRGVKWTPAHWEWDDVLQRERLARILLEAGLPRMRRARVLG